MISPASSGTQSLPSSNCPAPRSVDTCIKIHPILHELNKKPRAISFPRRYPNKLPQCLLKLIPSIMAGGSFLDQTEKPCIRTLLLRHTQYIPLTPSRSISKQPATTYLYMSKRYHQENYHSARYGEEIKHLGQEHCVPSLVNDRFYYLCTAPLLTLFQTFKPMRNCIFTARGPISRVDSCCQNIEGEGGGPS